MTINTLTYTGREWQGTLQSEEEILVISLSDATFQKHLNAHLEQMGIPTQTYLELMAMVQQVCEQRFQAAQHLSNLEYWRTCNDPGVRIMTCMSRRRE